MINLKKITVGEEKIPHILFGQKVIPLILFIFFLLKGNADFAYGFPPSFLLSQTDNISNNKVSHPSSFLDIKNEVILFINEKNIYVKRPILVENGKVFLPLKEIAPNLYFGLLDLKNGKFRLISPQGETKDIEALLIEEEAMISEEELKDYFSVDAYFDAGQNFFYIKYEPASRFTAYSVEKSEEELLKEEKEREEAGKKNTVVFEKPAVIPQAAQPSIKLKGTLAYTYISYNLSGDYRSIYTSLQGKMYDFNLLYASNYKDTNNVLNHDYTYLNLSKPDLYIGLFDQSIDLYPLRLQSQSFNGFKVAKQWDTANKTSFIGGEIENTVSGTSGSTVKYLGNIYGFKEEFSPWPWLGLKGGVFYLENEADIPSLSGTSSYPRNNLVSFSEAAFKLPYDLIFSTALAHCYYKPDNDTTGSAIEDWDLRIASQWDRKRYKLGLSYELVGDQYASFGNPVSYQDYNGWNLYSSYNVSNSWSLYSSLLFYHNNVDDDPDKITTKNSTFSLSSYHRLAEDKTVNLTFSHLLTNSSGPLAGADTAADLGRADYFFPFLFGMRSNLNYQYYQNNSIETSDYYSHTMGGSLFKSFGKGASWYLSQQFTKTLYRINEDNLNSNTSFNIDYMLTPLVSLYFNTSLTRDKTDHSAVSKTLSGAGGSRWQISPDSRLNLEYRVISYDTQAPGSRWPQNWSIMAYISQSFGLSTPPNFGLIEGWVFKDINGNGNFDSGELGLEGVSLYLKDKREAVTAANGYFKFSYVVPGKQEVSLDLANLPEDWLIPDKDKEIEVKPRKNNTINFPLVKASSIKGKVFVDANSDFVFQNNEEVVDNIGILLIPQEQFRRTNSEGEFKFEYLLPGKYKLRVIPEHIPVGYELASEEEMEVEIKAGEEKKDVVFILRLKPAP